MEGQEKTIHPDFLQDIFLEETWKNIDRMDEFIERKTTEEEIHFTTEEVDELFRTMHSIKGSSAMMGYPAISETAHSAEDLFSYLRDEQNPAQEDMQTITRLLKMASGYLKRELRRIETEEEVTDFGWSVVRRIKNFLAHVDTENEPEGPSFQIAYTRKGKKIIPYCDFSALVPQMERLANVMKRELDKEFEIRFSGVGTEVPLELYEKISDAVLQMTKNSIDHGIEPVHLREAMGKTPVGTVSLEIQKSSQRVIVVLRDDGKGLNRKDILAMAKEKGLLKKSEEEYEDSEVFAFLLRSGFTTKHSADLFSGRGVGLDVVHAGVAALGGTIRIESREYMGTTIFMDFPLPESTCETGENPV